MYTYIAIEKLVSHGPPISGESDESASPGRLVIPMTGDSVTSNNVVIFLGIYISICTYIITYINMYIYIYIHIVYILYTYCIHMYTYVYMLSDIHRYTYMVRNLAE